MNAASNPMMTLEKLQLPANCHRQSNVRQDERCAQTDHVNTAATASWIA
jgi:hypothetical protein